MTVSLTIPASERRVLRLFALDLSPAEASALRAPLTDEADRLAPLLGLTRLNHAMAEVVEIADLADLGLAGYLTAAHGIPPSQLTPDRATLNSLTGFVLVLFCEALVSRPAQLHLDPRVTLIGTYAEDLPPVRFEPLPDAAALGLLPQGKPVWSDARIGGMVATAVLIFLALFTFAFIWMA